jgi:hypothetical protein
MNRRKFLRNVVSTAVAAQVTAQGVRAAGPCPPTSPSLDGVPMGASECVVAPGTAPAWFTDPSFPVGTWKEIASSGTMQTALAPIPEPTVAISSPSSFTDAYSGGCVDQARREYIMVAGGGHGDGYNNAGCR